MARFFRRYKSTIYGNYRRAYLVDGTLTGLVLAAAVALRSGLGEAPMSTPENYLTELVLAVGIFLSSYLYRKQLPEGKVTLKELMLLGLGIGVVSALIYGTLVEHYNSQRVAVMEDAASSPEAQMAVETVKGYTAGDWAFIAGFRTAVMSVIITFFAALVFRTEKGEIRTKN